MIPRSPAFSLGCLTVLLATGLAACAHGSSPGPRTADGLELAVYDDHGSGSGDTALLVGSVVDQDGCLTVRQEGTGTSYVPTFPRDATASARELRDGQPVSLQGGAVGARPADVQAPPACDAAGDYWMVVATTS